jgi:hypothetical protein
VIFVGVGIGHESSGVFRTEAYRTRLWDLYKRTSVLVLGTR